MRQLLIIRHGLAHCNVTGIVGGAAGCTGLTQHGRSQIRALAERLASDPAITDAALFSSTARRCRETAQILAAELCLDDQPVSDLREPDHGPAADGKTWAQIIAAFPGRPADHPERPLVPGGETWRAYLIRTTQAIERILGTTTARTVIVSGHAETVRAAWQHFSGHTEVPAALPVKMVVGNASITRWVNPAGQPNRWVLDSRIDMNHDASSPARPPVNRPG